MSIDVTLPRPKMMARKINMEIEAEASSLGLHPIIARIISSRPLPQGFSLEDIITPKLSHLLAPQMMADMDRAATRLASAIVNEECIGIETDHDCDGQTSHAVLFYNLSQRFKHPASLIRSYIGHRLTEGYGLSDSVAARILADDPRPSLLITADNGSSDEPRIAKLKVAGIDVLVTDHHAIPVEGYPKSAFACLNPTRSECSYGDPFIAGCMVAWLLMAATRQKLIECGHLAKDAPTLSDSLDFVAVGTIADCVSMARSQNNRAIVAYGMRLISKGNRPCWRAILAESNNPRNPIRSEDLGFRIGPLLNSDGRLASAFGSVSFLLAETDEEARDWIQSLKDQNEQRKAIQKGIVKQAMDQASDQVAAGQYSICIYLEEGHSGVQGIAASRIKDSFGRPTAIFAPKHVTHKLGTDKHGTDKDADSIEQREALITGSVRGIDEIHVRDALQWVSDSAPGLLLAFGGHKGAGGLTLEKKNFKEFQTLFEAAVRAQFEAQFSDHSHESLGPVIQTDGPLETEYLNLDLLDFLNELEPFGREFEAPIFELEGSLVDLKPVGDGTHARVQLEVEGLRFTGIWFGMRQTSQSSLPVTKGASVRAAFSLRENYFRGQRSLDIQIIQMEELA